MSFAFCVIIGNLFTTLINAYQRALHCLADFLCNSDAILDHWFNPYFMTAAFNISSYTVAVKSRNTTTHISLLPLR